MPKKKNSAAFLPRRLAEVGRNERSANANQIRTATTFTHAHGGLRGARHGACARPGLSSRHSAKPPHLPTSSSRARRLGGRGRLEGMLTAWAKSCSEDRDEARPARRLRAHRAAHFFGLRQSVSVMVTFKPVRARRIAGVDGLRSGGSGPDFRTGALTPAKAPGRPNSIAAVLRATSTFARVSHERAGSGILNR